MGARAVRVMSLLPVLWVAACGMVGFEPPQTVVVQVESTDAAVQAQAAAILVRRFERYLPHGNSQVEYLIRNGALVFTFTHGAPDAEAIEYLGRVTGRFRLYADGDAEHPWLTEKDLKDAVLIYSPEGKRLIAIVTLPEAGARLQSLTSPRTGQVADWSLDGVVMSRARISGPFGERFQVSAPDEKSSSYVPAVLRFGALPTDVTSVEIQKQ